MWLVWAGQGVQPGDGAQPPRRRVPKHVLLTWFACHLTHDRCGQTFWPTPWMGWIPNPCARVWSGVRWGWLLVMRWVNLQPAPSHVHILISLGFPIPGGREIPFQLLHYWMSQWNHFAPITLKKLSFLSVLFLFSFSVVFLFLWNLSGCWIVWPHHTVLLIVYIITHSLSLSS